MNVELIKKSVKPAQAHLTLISHAYACAMSGGVDLFIAKMRNDPTYTLEWQTYYGSDPNVLGTEAFDLGMGIDIGPNEELFVGVWWTLSDNFEVVGAAPAPIQSFISSAGLSDGGIIKFVCGNGNNVSRKGFVNNETELNNEISTGIIIYPNPFNNETNLVITGEEEEIYSLKIFNTLGGVAAEKDNVNSNEVISFGEDLSNGMYIVQVIGKNKTFTERIIKTR